ncbi:unnamed protein product, partial [Cuscuta europaea]
MIERAHQNVRLKDSRDRVTSLESEVSKLKQSVLDLTKERNDFKRQCSEAVTRFEMINNECGHLYSKIKELDDILAKKGQTEEIIHVLNSKIKDTQFYNPREGLGFQNHENLKKIECPQSYDIKYMNLGSTKLMKFTYGSETIKEEEDKSKNRARAEVSFDYTALNDSYATREISLSDDYVICSSPEKQNVSDKESTSTSK